MLAVLNRLNFVSEENILITRIRFQGYRSQKNNKKAKQKKQINEQKGYKLRQLVKYLCIIYVSSILLKENHGKSH